MGEEYQAPGMPKDDAFVHLALFYRDAADFLTATRAFIDEGVSAGEPVLVAVPGAKIASMCASQNGSARWVEFWNMNELGANPGRIIPAVRDWVERRPSGRCRFVGEPIWPGRDEPEITEATRHEALINLAFADAPVTILCPYDTAGLEDAVVSDAECTHPLVVSDGTCCPSGRYDDPLALWRAADRPLPKPAEAVTEYKIGIDLADMRAFAVARLREAGVLRSRVPDIVLAIDEAATNALVHGRGESTLRIWRDHDRVTCEVTDEGRLDDPLAGRRRPQPEWTRGRGVWMMNQLCDLVELRPTSAGTAVRLHVTLGSGAPQGYSSGTSG